MQIDGRAVDISKNYLDPVTYVPAHANGNAGHEDCEKGNIISVSSNAIKVLYSKSRTVQSTNPEDLVWG